MRYQIIGNGIAGISAARAIRELDAEGEIVIVGDEVFPPYSRPMISMVLDGSQPHEKLPLFREDVYAQLNLTAKLGQRVNGLDVDGKRTRLTDGQWLDFDRLLIASGADPRPVKAEGANLANIFYMRTESQVKAQVAALDGVRRALVLGGGLVGFKAAYGLLKRGIKVTMLITSGYPLSMQVDDVAGRLIQDQLEAHGLDVRVGESVIAFEGNGKVAAAVTRSGEHIAGDLVIIGKGVLPALEFVPRDRMAVDLGIVVDEHLQTGIPGIYAAGDVAEAVDIARQTPWINAIWPEAADQGRTAGFNMAGRPVAYRGSLSRNVMRVFDLDVMTLGYANPGDDDGVRVVRSNDTPQECTPQSGYRSLVFREDLLVGAVLINRIDQGGVLRALIENRVPISLPPQRLMAPDFNFGRLLP